MLQQAAVVRTGRARSSRSWWDVAISEAGEDRAGGHRSWIREQGPTKMDLFGFGPWRSGLTAVEQERAVVWGSSEGSAGPMLGLASWKLDAGSEKTGSSERNAPGQQRALLERFLECLL